MRDPVITDMKIRIGELESQLFDLGTKVDVLTQALSNSTKLISKLTEIVHKNVKGETNDS